MTKYIYFCLISQHLSWQYLLLSELFLCRGPFPGSVKNFYEKVKVIKFKSQHKIIVVIKKKKLNINKKYLSPLIYLLSFECKNNGKISNKNIKAIHILYESL